MALTRDQRDVPYELVMTRLTGIGDVWIRRGRSRRLTGGHLCRRAGSASDRSVEHNYDVQAWGEIEDEDGVLVIKRIRVRYRLPIPEHKRAEAERAHAAHPRACPVARSIGGSVDIQTELEIV